MTLNKILSISALVVLSSLTFADEKSGEALFKINCSACHGTTGGMDMKKRLAPPIVAVRSHYISTYSDKDSFVNAIVNWVAKPDESQTMMRGAIRHFKIMPTLGVPTADVEKIAAYIYEGELDKPEGLDEHIAKEHGKNGGMGDGEGKHKKGMME